jgi:hypothetical protein
MKYNIFIKISFMVLLLIVIPLSYAQNINSRTLQKYGIYCDIIIPTDWGIFPNNDPSRNIIADLYPPNRRGERNDIPSITIVIRELSQPSDTEMYNLINTYNQTNIRNLFRVSREDNTNYIIYTAVGYNSYSSTLYIRYENYCIYLYSHTDTEESNNILLKLMIEMANNLNLRKMG